MADDSFDVYADLEVFDARKREEEKLKSYLSQQVDDLNTLLETQRESYEKRIRTLEEQKANLNRNCSSLLETARRETRRKDEEKRRLQEERDNVVFRRRTPRRLLREVGVQTEDLKRVNRSTQSLQKSLRHRAVQTDDVASAAGNERKPLTRRLNGKKREDSLFDFGEETVEKIPKERQRSPCVDSNSVGYQEYIRRRDEERKQLEINDRKRKREEDDRNRSDLREGGRTRRESDRLRRENDRTRRHTSKSSNGSRRNHQSSRSPMKKKQKVDDEENKREPFVVKPGKFNILKVEEVKTPFKPLEYLWRERQIEMPDDTTQDTTFLNHFGLLSNHQASTPQKPASESLQNGLKPLQVTPVFGPSPVLGAQASEEVQTTQQDDELEEGEIVDDEEEFNLAPDHQNSPPRALHVTPEPYEAPNMSPLDLSILPSPHRGGFTPTKTPPPQVPETPPQQVPETPGKSLFQTPNKTLTALANVLLEESLGPLPETLQPSHPIIDIICEEAQPLLAEVQGINGLNFIVVPPEVAVTEEVQSVQEEEAQPLDQEVEDEPQPLEQAPEEDVEQYVEEEPVVVEIHDPPPPDPAEAVPDPEASPNPPEQPPPIDHAVVEPKVDSPKPPPSNPSTTSLSPADVFALNENTIRQRLPKKNLFPTSPKRRISTRSTSGRRGKKNSPTKSSPAKKRTRKSKTKTSKAPPPPAVVPQPKVQPPPPPLHLPPVEPITVPPPDVVADAAAIAPPQLAAVVANHRESTDHSTDTPSEGTTKPKRPRGRPRKDRSKPPDQATPQPAPPATRYSVLTEPVSSCSSGELAKRSQLITNPVPGTSRMHASPYSTPYSTPSLNASFNSSTSSTSGKRIIENKTSIYEIEEREDAFYMTVRRKKRPAPRSEAPTQPLPAEHFQPSMPNLNASG